MFSVVGALKVAREKGSVVKKGRGWWEAVEGGGGGNGERDGGLVGGGEDVWGVGGSDCRGEG